MRKYILTICALFAFSASASAITVDFNSAVGDPNGYTDQGITFTYNGTGSSFYGTAPNGSNAQLMRFDNTSFWNADIAGGATAVSVDLGDYNQDADQVFLSIFDSANNLLDMITQDLADSFTGMVTLSLASASTIAYANYGTTGALGISGIYSDNFTVSPVPLPAAAWLFGSALLGFFGFSRRKSNS